MNGWTYRIDDSYRTRCVMFLKGKSSYFSVSFDRMKSDYEPILKEVQKYYPSCVSCFRIAMDELMERGLV